MDDKKDKTKSLSDGQKSEIIGHVYDVAIDPKRYENLLDIWEEKLGPIRSDLLDGRSSDDDFRDAVLESHLHRADILLDRHDEAQGSNPVAKALQNLMPSAAFATNKDGLVVLANDAAMAVFAISPQKSIENLPFTRDQLVELRNCISRSVRQHDGLVRYFRAETIGSKRLVVFRISPFAVAADHEDLFLIVSTELAWPETLSATLRDAFSLTVAEADVVRGLTEGYSVQEIADQRERSLATVRTQIRSILAKTETKTQAELIRITLNLMDVVGETKARSPDVTHLSRSPTLAPVAFQTLMRPDGRRFDYLVLGDPNGTRNILYFPSTYCLSRWPASAERYAAEQGIRIIVPIRPGYGYSTQVSDRTKLMKTVVDDCAALLDHLKVPQCPVIALAEDGIFAFHFNQFHPGRLTAILGFGGGLPYFKKGQYDRMDKWHKFILANARYAPLLLPFLVKAGYSLARRIGKEDFVKAVHGGSPGDMKTFENPEVREAMVTGSEISLSEKFSAHSAFSNEMMVSQSPWQKVVHDCRIPVIFFMGHEDPMMPPATIAEMRQEYTNIEYLEYPDCGELLFMKHWKDVLARALPYCLPTKA